MPHQYDGHSASVEGTVKVWQEKKWKTWYCVVQKLEPEEDAVHLYKFKNEKLRRKWCPKLKPLKLYDFFGTETGFTLEKENVTLAVICRSTVVLLAFNTEELLTEWNLWLRQILGYGCQYRLQIDCAPVSTTLTQKQYIRMHIQNGRFCLTTDCPPRLVLDFNITDISRYGSVHNQFCFIAGRKAGPYAGSYRMITGQCDQINEMFEYAAVNELHNHLYSKSRCIESVIAANRLPPLEETLNNNNNKDIAGRDSNKNASLATARTKHGASVPFYRSIFIDRTFPLSLSLSDRKFLRRTTNCGGEYGLPKMKKGVEMLPAFNDPIFQPRDKMKEEKVNSCACCRRRRDYMNQIFIDSLQYYYNMDGLVKSLSMKSKLCDHQDDPKQQLSKSEPTSPSPNCCQICDTCRSASYKNLPTAIITTSCQIPAAITTQCQITASDKDDTKYGSATFIFNEVYTPMSPASNNSNTVNNDSSIQQHMEQDNYVKMENCYPRSPASITDETKSPPGILLNKTDNIRKNDEDLTDKRVNVKKSAIVGGDDLVSHLIKPAPVYSVEAVREKRRIERLRRSPPTAAGLPTANSSLPASWSSDLYGTEAPQNVRKMSMSPVDDNVFDENASLSRSSPIQTGQLDLDEVPYSAPVTGGGSGGFKFGSLFNIKRTHQRRTRDQFKRPVSGSYSVYDGDGPESPLVTLCKVPESPAENYGGIDNRGGCDYTTVTASRVIAPPVNQKPREFNGKNPPSRPVTVPINRYPTVNRCTASAPINRVRLPPPALPAGPPTFHDGGMKKPPISAPPPLTNFRGGRQAENVFRFPPCSSNSAKSATVPGHATTLNYCELAMAKPPNFLATPSAACGYFSPAAHHHHHSVAAQNLRQLNSPTAVNNKLALIKTPNRQNQSSVSYVEIDEMATKAVSKNSTARAYERMEKSFFKNK